MWVTCESAPVFTSIVRIQELDTGAGRSFLSTWCLLQQKHKSRRNFQASLLMNCCPPWGLMRGSPLSSTHSAVSSRLGSLMRKDTPPSKTPTPPCYRQSDGRNAGVISAQLPQSLREKHPMCITSASLSLSLSRPHSHSLPRPTCCHADTSRVVMKQLRLRSIHFKMKTIKKKDVDKQSEFLLELGRQPTHILISISCSFGCFVNSSQGKSIKCWKKVKMCLISEAETGTFLAFWI